MSTPRGTWPVTGSESFQTTCSQCHTHISTPRETGPVICPRCKALITAEDGQPFGTPIFRVLTEGLSQDEAFEARYGMTMEEAANAVLKREGTPSGGTEAQ